MVSLRHTNPGAALAPLGRRRTTSAKTANYVVTSAESGTVFTTEGAGGAVVFTLPATADGLWFIFINAEDQDMTISSDAVDTLVCFNDITGDQIAMNQASEKIGGGFFVYADGSKWMVAELRHDAQTANIAT